MALARIKNWIVETLTASDLNAEFNNILNNGEDLAWPATKAKDLDGQELIFDADGDTSLTASTDDLLDFKIGGVDRTSVGTEGFQGQADIIIARSVFGD